MGFHTSWPAIDIVQCSLKVFWNAWQNFILRVRILCCLYMMQKVFLNPNVKSNFRNIYYFLRYSLKRPKNIKWLFCSFDMMQKVILNPNVKSNFKYIHNFLRYSLKRQKNIKWLFCSLDMMHKVILNLNVKSNFKNIYYFLSYSNIPDIIRSGLHVRQVYGLKKSIIQSCLAQRRGHSKKCVILCLLQAIMVIVGHKL